MPEIPRNRAILSERKITRVDLIYQPLKDIIFLGESWCYGYYLAACQETDPNGAEVHF
jgi:hypothetical protein